MAENTEICDWKLVSRWRSLDGHPLYSRDCGKPAQLRHNATRWRNPDYSISRSLCDTHWFELRRGQSFSRKLTEKIYSLISDCSLVQFAFMDCHRPKIENLSRCYKWAWAQVRENDGRLAVLTTFWGPDVIMRPDYMTKEEFLGLLPQWKLLRFAADAGQQG